MKEINSWRRRKPAVLIIVLCMGLMSSTGTATAAPFFSVQVGAYTTAAEAILERERFERLCPPAIMHFAPDNVNFPYKVFVGGFDTYAEAWVYKSKLGTQIAPGCFVARSDHMRNLLGPPNCEAIMPFNVHGLDEAEPEHGAKYWESGGFQLINPISSELLQKDPVLMTREELLVVGLSAARYPDHGVAALEQFLAQFPLDPLRNRAVLILARMLGRGTDFARADALLAEVRSTGSMEERAMALFLSAHLEVNRKRHAIAFHAFCSVANDTSNPPSLRHEAMSRAAACAHVSNQYPEAWLAFRQIRATAQTGAEAANAQLEMAGLAFELVSRGKGGDWAQIRELCNAVSATTGVLPETQATASLMHLETLFEEGKFHEALSAVQAFCLSYSDVSREYHMARVWHGLILFRLHLHNEARDVLRSVADSTIGAADKFGGNEPRARAAIWLAWIEHNHGVIESRDHWVNLLRHEFPNSPETQLTQTLFNN